MRNVCSKLASLAMLALFCATTLEAQESDISTAPWDYRDPRYAGDLNTVQRHHFNLDVQMLRRGQSGAFPGKDLAFILRFFPNHHGALNSMGRLYRNHARNGERPPDLPVEKTADTWFGEAIEFAPDDGVVHMLYAMHLTKTGQDEKAATHYEKALALNPESAEVQYNAGLYYFSAGDLQAAATHARQAYRMGYPLPGLKNKLSAAGVWDGSLEQTRQPQPQ